MQEFLDQHVHRPAVGDDVVQGQQQDVLLCRQLQQAHPQQRAAGQVEGGQGFGFGDGFDGGLANALVQLGQGILAQLQRGGDGVYLLTHVIAVGDEAGAQGFVAGHQGIEGVLQRGQVQRAMQAYGHGQVVGCALRVELPEEPHAPLGVRQLVTLGHLHAGRDRQHGKIHALALQRLEE
ncbi:hypothetical protein D3C77_556120 [compost metagenome]